VTAALILLGWRNAGVARYSCCWWGEDMKTCPLCDATYPNHHSSCDKDGALLIESRDLEPGTVIRGKYRVVRLLGRGGMGTVYLAEHILLGQQRALKFISSELSQDARFLKRFRHEAQAAIKLRHPNVVEVVDLDQAEDGSPYIAMEYVDGEDLRHALAAGAFPVERALAIAHGIAQGLGAAHAKGIVHRDVKPENVLLAGGDGTPKTPKLLDFGIAAIQERATAITRTHGLLLTQPYAAPEQWQGMASDQLDGRADLYALGGVLYEMLTGQTPFRANNTEGWMHRHLHEQPQPPSHIRPDLANWPGLDALVQRLLAKDREDRPKDVADLLGLLNAVQFPPSAVRQETEFDQAASIQAQNIAGSSVKPVGRWGVWSGVMAAGFILAALAVSHRPVQPSNSTGQTPSAAHQIDANQGTIPEMKIPAGATLLPLGEGPTVEIEQKAEALFYKKRYSESAKLFTLACNAGWARGCAYLAYQVDQGYGIAQDESRAATLATKACNAGDSFGCDGIGQLYESGGGVEQDYSRAAASFTKACNSGSSNGCTNLATMYEEGKGVDKDEARAFSLYTKACNGDDGGGCNHLGVMYHDGKGIEKNEAQALSLWIKACNHDNADGCNELGYDYDNGLSVPKDESRAAKLFSKACDGGSALGCSNLGNYYRLGSGVAKDSEKARKLLTKGCNMGNQWGCDRLKEME